MLPKLDKMTVGEFLAKASVTKKCIKVPGLQVSAHESSLIHVFSDILPGMDARTLMMLWHCKHGTKEGNFTKTLLDLQHIPLRATQQPMVHTIHSPLHLENVLPLNQCANFVHTIMIIEYPMIGFLDVCYFFCARTECAMIKQAFSGYALLIIE